MQAVERALRVRLPSDYRSFVLNGGGMKVVGDEKFGFGVLTVFDVSKLKAKKEELERAMPGGEGVFVPLFLAGDELEQGVHCTNAEGEMFYVHARDEDVEAIGSFETELIEALGALIVPKPKDASGAAGANFAVGTFASVEEAEATEALFDDAEPGTDALDFVDPSDGKQLEYLRLDRQIVVLHPSARRFDRARLRSFLAEHGAVMTFDAADRLRVVVRSKTRRSADLLEEVFINVSRDFSDSSEWFDDERTRRLVRGARYVMDFDSKTAGRSACLEGDEDDATEKLVHAVLSLLRHKGAKDWELSFSTIA